MVRIRLSLERFKFMSQTIIFIHPYFQGGGVEKSIIRLSRIFRKYNYKCEILTFCANDSYRQELEELEIKVINLPCKRMLFSIPHIAKYINNKLKENDKIFLVSNQSYVNVIAVISRFFISKKVRLILCERLHYAEYALKSPIKRVLIPLMMRITYPFADARVAISTELAADTQKLTNSKFECIFNPALDDDIHSKASEPLELPWDTTGIKVITSIGRLARVKGFDILIEAFYKIHKEIPNTKLIIVGEGSEKDSLVSLISKYNLNDHVWLPGFDPNPYKYLKRSDLFALSSYYEGLGNVLIEAIACNIPCISTNCKAGPSDILLNGEGGELVPVGDADALADATIKLLNNKKTTRQQLEAATAGLERFKPETVGLQFLQVVDPDFRSADAQDLQNQVKDQQDISLPS